MFTHSRKFPLFLVLGALLVLSAPLFAQNSAAPVANSARSQPAPAASTAQQQIPSWLPLAAILGSVLGLSGLGLAGYVFLQKSRTEQRLRTIAESYSKLEASLSSLDRSAVRVSTLENCLCQILHEQYNPNEAMGFSVLNALSALSWKQAHFYVSREVEPKLTSVGQSASKTRADLEGFIGYVKGRDGEVRTTLAAHETRASQIAAAFETLDARTRSELEAFVFNIYNLLFTQSEGDPVVPQLENRIQRYEAMLSELRAIAPDEVTRLTLREFEETLDKLAQKLRDARASLANARSVAVEPLPYLEEKDRARAQTLLEEQRKKMRGQTAGAKESLDALRDAAIELAKPLQTLWMGASVPDPDRPQRNERCRTLLAHIKTILETAGIHIYEPQIGGPLDTTRATHRFVAATHEAPFVVQKVTKLGLQVEDRIEPGAVVVA
jgi:hypothetical protein